MKIYSLVYHDSVMKLEATNFEGLEEFWDLLPIRLRDQSLSGWRKLGRGEIWDVFRRNVGANVEVVRGHDDRSEEVPGDTALLYIAGSGVVRLSR